MKVLKFFGNLIGVLLSIVVALALLVTLIAAPVLSGVTEMVRNDTLLKMAQTIITVSLDETPSTPVTPDDLDPALPEFAEDKWVGELLETDLAEKLINLYMDEFMAAAMTDGTMALDLQTVKAMVTEHMDEILPIVRQAVTEAGETMSDAEIEDAILSFVDESGQELLDGLPTPTDLDMDEELALALSLLRSNLLRVGLAVAVAVLSILILLFRFPRFKGFMWLAVVYILGALSSFGTGAGASALLPELLFNEEPLLADLLAPAVIIFSKTCTMGGAIMLVLAVVFILIFALGRKAQKKRKARKAAAAEAPVAAAAVENAPAAETSAAAVPSYVTRAAAAAAEKDATPVTEQAAPAPVAEVAPAPEVAQESTEESEPEL